MFKKMILIVIVISTMVTGSSFAQSTDPSSNVFFFFAACETQGVIDFNGTMEAGYDIYVQLFDQVSGGGTALSPLTRVSVNGDYQVSQVLSYSEGRTLLLGQFASAVITIAGESNSDNVIYSDGIDDVRDGCIDPAYSSTDTFVDGQSGSSTPLVDPVTGNIIGTGEVIASSGIFTPDGGTLNDVFSAPQEAIVQIGARPSDISDTTFDGRVTDPGLIFAECDQYPLADPGVVWDVDTITVFWSWYAATPELVQQHIDNAQYEVFLSSEYAYRQAFPDVDVSAITEREDGNFYVFYTANLGNGFRSGAYEVDYYLTWDAVIDDGYDLFGPGTATEFFINTCTFDVARNPFGVTTEQNNPTTPLQQ